jgi:hypothetical protein
MFDSQNSDGRSALAMGGFSPPSATSRRRDSGSPRRHGNTRAPRSVSGDRRATPDRNGDRRADRRRHSSPKTDSLRHVPPPTRSGAEPAGLAGPEPLSDTESGLPSTALGAESVDPPKVLVKGGLKSYHEHRCMPQRIVRPNPFAGNRERPVCIAGFSPKAGAMAADGLSPRDRRQRAAFSFGKRLPPRVW